MLISIITLNYNKPQLTASCIASLFEQYEMEFANNILELIIVDNASTDNSVKELQNIKSIKEYKNMKVIANSENSGFGKGCNIGSTDARGKYLLFLNNDTEVKDQGFIEMADYMEEHSEVAILGGQLRNSDNSKQVSVGSFYTLFSTLLYFLGLQKYDLLDKNPTTIQKVDWVKGGLFMMRHDVFDKLHGFDEKIFMYTEDMELCYRAKLQGLNTYFFPDIQVIHKEHGSTNRTFAIVNIYKNFLYFYKKHRSFFEYAIVKGILIAKAGILIITGTILHNKYLTETYKKAYSAIT